MHRHLWPQADGPALIGGDRALTFAELREAATEVAAGLDGFAGQRVLIVAPNAPEFVIALLAVWRSGAVAVPLGTRSREHELSTALADSGAVAALAVDAHGGYSFATALAALGLPGQETEHGLTLFTGGEENQPVREDVAAILYTSGSTGAPKGAYLTHTAAALWGELVAELLSLTEEDRTALVIPAAHAFGLVSTLAALVSGGTTVFVDNARSPEPLIQAVTDHAVTVLHGSPAVFAGLLETAPQVLAGVRTGMVGGAASPPGLIERLDAAGPRILNAYGMTEIGPACAVRPDDPPTGPLRDRGPRTGRLRPARRRTASCRPAGQASRPGTTAAASTRSPRTAGSAPATSPSSRQATWWCAAVRTRSSTWEASTCSRPRWRTSS